MLAAGAALSLAAAAFSHEIPADVRVRVFIHPEDTTLRVLVRVPLESMRDMSVPTRERGYLDLDRAGPVLRDAAILWISDYMRIYENDDRLVDPSIRFARVSLPTDPSFESYPSALAHVTGAPLSPETEIFWEQGVLDVLFDYTIQSEDSDFSLNPGLERLGIRVINILRFVDPDGEVHAFDFPGNPGRIPLKPKWHEVFFRFVELGFFHILEGLDHLLFLFCLILPFRKLRSLVWIVTSFTVAHSITLVASAIGYAPNSLWFPPLIETLIAISILYMAFENIVGAKLHHRWVMTFGFGLVHGFGFSFMLRDTLQFAGSHLSVSLLAFNIGVELGQLLVLVITIPALALLFRVGVPERLGTIYLSALVTHSAWHWMTERIASLRQFSFPAVDASFLASTLRMLIFAVLFAAVVWVASLFKPRKNTPVETRDLDD